MDEMRSEQFRGIKMMSEAARRAQQQSEVDIKSHEILRSQKGKDRLEAGGRVGDKVRSV